MYIVCFNYFCFYFFQINLPIPFPIPKFRASTEENLRKSHRIDTDRKYMVQTLGTMLMTYIQKPSLNHCRIIAKVLISKYPFLKDDEGDGEVSFSITLIVIIISNLFSTHGNGLYIIIVKTSTDPHLLMFQHPNG